MSIVPRRADAKYCSGAHRVAAHRAQKATGGIPLEMINRDRWVRWKTVIRNGRPTKAPLTTTGKYASSTDPRTWASHDRVTRSTVGNGIGFVLGEGIGCIDLDHCLVDGAANEAATQFIADYPHHFIEVSPSGDGLHIWGTAPESPGSKRNEQGLSIERYSTGRYITVTGIVYQHGQLLPV